MAHRSQSSSIGDNPLDPNYLPPHYREQYRLAIDALIENDIQGCYEFLQMEEVGYYEFLQMEEVVGFLAQPEIEYIKSTLQLPSQPSGVPELMYQEGAPGDEGSSDTYWPVQSDLAAPGLDLGWPLPQHSFVGPTEVTTLVNPTDPEMPSIKEQARRLIKNARQVIAVVMDVFTDVDIFTDLLEAAARHVPVYILLDEQNAHHFVSMMINYKVNPHLSHMMRIRTVAGITYYSRTGASFKGQVKDCFLLTDCKAVLSGNYSFMWSYEKIHRCIAHLFLGELVSTFDEEFRILFAQSEPLVLDGGALAVPEPSGYLNAPFGLKRTQSLRNPAGYRRQPEVPLAFPYGDSDRNPALPFRRQDPFRAPVEPNAGISIGKYSQQQFRLQQSYLEQGRSIVSRQMEVGSSSYKRHSYAEGTQENYSSSRQYMKHRVMNNLEETDFHRDQFQSSHFYSEGPGPGSGHGHYDRLRGRPPHLAIDQYSDSSYRSDLEPPPGSYGRDFSSEDLGGPEGLQAPPLAGRYGGGSAHRRPTAGQAYACQKSPTQLHLPEKKPTHTEANSAYDQDANLKHGLRDWRINSYLSAYEDGGEEGLPQPMGADAFEDPASSQQPTRAEGSAPYFGMKEPPAAPPKPRPDILSRRFGKPNMPDKSNKDSFSDFKSSALEKKDREEDRERNPARSAAKEPEEEMEVKESADLFLTRHESFRSRINPLLQRSSRLRSSLIFSSSKAEVHSGSLGLKAATEEDEELDSGRTTSIVAKMLEKRRSLSREPFEWRKKTEERDKLNEKEEKEKEQQQREREREREARLKEESKAKEEPQEADAEVKATQDGDKSEADTYKSDAASRLQHFNEQAAKRKSLQMETAPSLKDLEPAGKKPDLSDKPPPNPGKTTAEPEQKKPDISSKLADLTRRYSLSSSKPPIITAKPFVSFLKTAEASQPRKEEAVSESQKKDILKSLKPLPSPKLFKKDPLKLKGLNPRRISCGEEVLVTDATDAEKSELKKSRSHSSSTLSHEDAKEGSKFMGSSTSINTIGESKGDGKKLDFLKKQTQRLKGLLGPKDKDKKNPGDDRGMSTVREVVDDPSRNQSSSAGDQSSANHKPSTATSSSSRYQSPGGSVLFSSNLRDDTKVILEQISANSQKNWQEREETSADKDGASAEKGQETQSALKKNRFLRPQGITQEREGLLKRIESLRKEKKVYSRFEMGNSLA